MDSGASVDAGTGAGKMTGLGHAVVVITGIQAAGKSTTAQALAERLPRSVHVRGDVFRRMVVGGRADLTALIRSRPLLVVVLAPSVDTVAAREAARAKDAYGTWAIERLDEVLRHQTPRIGLWLDTSRQTSAETAEEILARGWAEARIAEPSSDP